MSRHRSSSTYLPIQSGCWLYIQLDTIAGCLDLLDGASLIALSEKRKRTRISFTRSISQTERYEKLAETVFITCVDLVLVFHAVRPLPHGDDEPHQDHMRCMYTRAVAEREQLS